MILDNPFHVLGLPADCTTKELNRRKAQAEAYLRIGKPLEFDEDLYVSRHCHRNSSTLGLAIKQLHDGRERMQHGLFWFTRGGPLDAHALRLLARGRTRDAYEALARIGSRPVDAANAPSLNNLGTLCLLLGLDPPSGETGTGGSELRSDRIMYGLRAKARLVGQLPEPDLVRFCAGLGDELAARDSGAVVEAFGESLKRAIDEAKRYGVSVSGRKQVEALDAGGARLAPIKGELGSAAREEIERAIKACEALRRRDPATANDTARELQAVLEVQLPALADAISTEDYLYRSLADRAAETLVTTTTVYFNYWNESYEWSVDDLLELLSISEYAAGIACGETTRQRARGDVATLRRMEQTERAKAQFAPAFAAMTEWFAACDVLGEDEGAATSRLEDFIRASLESEGHPGKSVIKPLATLNAPESPLSADFGVGESEAVAMNSNVCHRLLTLAVRAYNVSGGGPRVEEMLIRISTVFSPSRFPVDYDCAQRLGKNLAAVQHNRELQRAVASRSGCAGAFAAIVLLLLAGVLLVPGIVGAQPQQPAMDPLLRAREEADEARERRLEALEADEAALLDRIQSLEAGREQDAARIRELETALREADDAVRAELMGLSDEATRDREKIRRETGEKLAGMRDAAVRDRQDIRRETDQKLAEVVEESRRQVARLREEAESGFTGLHRETTENRAGLEDEATQRMRGDRQGTVFAFGALAFAGLGVGLLWRWSRHRTDGLGKRFDQSWSGLQEFLAESGDRSAKTLAALEELVSREAPSATDTEPDHKLVLLMCNEINRMENNLRHMDATARGHKKLLGVVRRMKENLDARGYEITALHGQRYDPGLDVVPGDWITDESLPPGREVISWVKTPEVRFRGEIVQSASVQIARNE